MKQGPVKLTGEVVEGLPLADGGQYLVRDTEEAGFFLVVGARTKTFTVQVDVVTPLGKRQTKKRALGKWPEMGVAEARRAARTAKADIPREGGKGRPKDRLTFGAAWGELRAYMEMQVAAGSRGQRTIDGYDYCFRLLGDWEKTPLALLSSESNEVRRRHREMTRVNGPSAANGAMVFLRRVYNYARKRRLDPTLPRDNPVEAIDFNEKLRRDTAMGARDLAGWHKKLRALPNPVRQEFHLFCLLSGSRPGALTVARWEHLDMQRRVLHIPRPKGGERRAFDIPLSRAMIACLARARRAGQMVNGENAQEWIFPGEGAKSHRPGFAGHLVEYREDRELLPKWGGDLRQTYKTLSSEAGLSKTDVMLLMNHQNKDVSDGYMTRAKVAEAYIRGQQETMSRYLVAAMGRG